MSRTAREAVKKAGPWLLVLVVAAAVLIAIGWGWTPLKPKAGMLQVGADVATSLFAVALFLERSLAVINDLFFPREGQTLLEEVADDPKREKVRVIVGFIFAVALSVAGMRTLNGLVESPPTGIQLDAFRVLDIVLTAGLLAGGSNGLAQIIEILRKQKDSLVARLEQDRRRAEPA